MAAGGRSWRNHTDDGKGVKNKKYGRGPANIEITIGKVELEELKKIALSSSVHLSNDDAFILRPLLALRELFTKRQIGVNWDLDVSLTGDHKE